MKRQIVRIDEDKCNGCGACVPACHEGAIRIVNGKARLAEDSLCDGLGACLGECPQGAITIEEREADLYKEDKVLENILRDEPEALRSHLKHLEDHKQFEYLDTARKYLKEKGINMDRTEKAGGASLCGCPGSMARDLRKERSAVGTEVKGAEAVVAGSSELSQWPIQLRLLNPHAPFFQGAELLVSADCVPFTYANFHQKFLKGKTLVMFCPKLDEDLEEYIEKLETIFRENEIKSVSIVRMEVPCCGGVESIVEEALRRSGKNIILRGHTISLGGEII